MIDDVRPPSFTKEQAFLPLPALPQALPNSPIPDLCGGPSLRTDLTADHFHIRIIGTAAFAFLLFCFGLTFPFSQEDEPSPSLLSHLPPINHSPARLPYSTCSFSRLGRDSCPDAAASCLRPTHHTMTPFTPESRVSWVWSP